MDEERRNVLAAIGMTAGLGGVGFKALKMSSKTPEKYQGPAKFADLQGPLRNVLNYSHIFSGLSLNGNILSVGLDDPITFKETGGRYGGSTEITYSPVTVAFGKLPEDAYTSPRNDPPKFSPFGAVRDPGIVARYQFDTLEPGWYRVRARVVKESSHSGEELPDEAWANLDFKFVRGDAGVELKSDWAATFDPFLTV